MIKLPISGCPSFFEEFKRYLKTEKVIEDDEEVEVFFEMDDMENLEDDLNYAEFLAMSFRKNYGDKLAKNLCFDVEIDYGESKYNAIKVTRSAKIGKYEYIVEINEYDCIWVSIAEDHEDFEKQVREFLKETKERVKNLIETVLNKNHQN